MKTAFKLNENHWTMEYYIQRATKKEVQEMLLTGTDRLIFHGIMRKLIFKHIGAGIYEIYKENKK